VYELRRFLRASLERKGLMDHLSKRPRWFLPAYEVVLNSCEQLREKLKANGQIVTLYPTDFVEKMFIAALGKPKMPLPIIKCMYEEFVISCKFPWFNSKENEFTSSSNGGNSDAKKVILAFQASLIEDCQILSPIHPDSDLLELQNYKLNPLFEKYTLPVGKRVWKENLPIIKLDDEVINSDPRVFSFYMAKLNAAHTSWTTAKEFDEETKGVTPSTFLR
jgi:hypothetical protein